MKMKRDYLCPAILILKPITDNHFLEISDGVLGDPDEDMNEAKQTSFEEENALSYKGYSLWGEDEEEKED